MKSSNAELTGGEAASRPESPAGFAPLGGCGASNVVFLDFDGVILTLRTTAACEVRAQFPDAFLHGECRPLEEIELSASNDLFTEPCETGGCFV